MTRPGAIGCIAAALWAAVLLARIGPDQPCPSTASGRCGPAVGAGPVAPRAIVASAAHTRPVTDLPVRSLTIARRIGLHQYGPRVGVLVDAFRIELRAKHEGSTIAVAPSRGHKTAAVVIPRVLDAPGPVVTTSTKADVLLATITRRARLGTIWVFDAENIACPFAPMWQRLRWNPLDDCQDPDVAIRRASALVGARPMGGVRNGDSSPERPAGCCGVG